MADENAEQVAGGLLGKVAGKAKEIAGEVTRNDNLAREGRLQQAHVDAEAVAAVELVEAEQEEAAAELVAERDEAEIERRRLLAEKAEIERERAIEARRVESEREVERKAAAEKQAVTQKEAAQKQVAGAVEHAARRDRAVAGAEITALERQARQAELVADVIDPEER